MIELLRCRQCKELIYSDDTVAHGCSMGFDKVDDDLEQDEFNEFMEDIHDDLEFICPDYPLFC